MLFSSVLHGMVIILMIVGLPHFCSTTPIVQESVITVEILPVSALSNVAEAKLKPKLPPTKPELAKPEPAKPEAKVEPAPEPAKPEPTPEPAKPELKPEPKPEPLPEKIVEEKKPAKPEPAKPEAKVEPKKLKPKPAKPALAPASLPQPKLKPKKTTELESLLKNLEESFENTEKGDSKKPQPTEEETNKSKGEYDDSLPLSISEMDLIRSQIEKHWSKPPAAILQEGIKVAIGFTVGQDGTIDLESIKLVKNKSSWPGDKYDLFTLTVESAIRAVKKTGQIKNLPTEKFKGSNGWGEVVITFDPNELN
jgi:outer membrane biosynthesis protein TonB